MPRPRSKENKGLPTRWRHRSGAYYYQVPRGLEAMWDGKTEFRLGSSLPEAYRVWADRLGKMEETRTVAELLDRYSLQVVPTKQPTTRAQNQVAIKRLRNVLGAAPITAIRPQIIYQYVEKRDAKVAARREIEILSHAFTKAVEWGILDRHPFKGEVRLPGEKSRTRYIADWEIDECLTLESKRKKGSVLALQAYIKIKLQTGMARSDLLRLQPDRDFDDVGIHIQRHKTAESSGKRTIYEWTEELREAVAEAIRARPKRTSKWLFCTLTGDGYIDEETGRAGGFDSMWRGFMERVLAETKVTERFTEHDLRAKVSSDAESIEHARALLSHTTTQTTQRSYRRKAEKVKPLRRSRSE